MTQAYDDCDIVSAYNVKTSSKPDFFIGFKMFTDI